MIPARSFATTQKNMVMLYNHGCNKQGRIQDFVKGGVGEGIQFCFAFFGMPIGFQKGEANCDLLNLLKGVKLGKKNWTGGGVSFKS